MSEMKKIASFCVDHTKLKRGMYLSRVDGDVVTYDLRFCEPNRGVYLDNAVMHTIEHIFATFVRNSKHGGSVIYFGPMGCRTGFYFLTRGLSHGSAIDLTRSALDFIAEFEGDIPGAAETECGNWREHDLSGAREAAAQMADVLKNWSEERLSYDNCI